MFTSLFKFVWIAFREYWGVWLTGTGAVGLLLGLLALTQNLTGWKLKPRHYAIVLFCVFWFLATFSAWRDADRNLTSVIAQRSKDNSKLAICTSDLRVAQETGGFFQKQAINLQTSFNTLQTSVTAFQGGVNGQQQALNSCVTTLEKLSPAVSTKIKTLVLPIEHRRMTGAPQPGPTYAYMVVILTNQKTVPKGRFRCDLPFRVLDDPDLTPQLPSELVQYGQQKAISDREYEINILIGGAEWNAENPIFFPILASPPGIGPCSFTQL